MILPSGVKTGSVAEAADSLLHFDFLRCTRLAGVGPRGWATYLVLSCGAASADAATLTLLVPLGSAAAGGAAIARCYLVWP
jgi:hypothetical protein